MSSSLSLVPGACATLVACGLGALWASRKGWRATCWFCHHRQRVTLRQWRSGWSCSECDQYNGFGPDGDYNRDDPARARRWGQQHDPDDDVVRFARAGSPAEGTSAAGQNGLCHTCNLNQSLKVHQLAKFEPENEANYDREVEAFQQRLERTYRLC